MQLQDHFHAPLSRHRHWDSFQGAWVEAMARQLNEDLPAHFYAEVRVRIGTHLEIDVATQEENTVLASAVDEGAVAVWVPSKPSVVSDLDFAGLDLFEVNIFNDEEGPMVVAAIELISPANKDRPSHRQAFSIKCASLLQDGISLILVDIVTERHGNLHADLLATLNKNISAPAMGSAELYATAYRTQSGAERSRLEIWAEPLAVGSQLPTMPLWLSADLAFPLNLEETYRAACAARRID